MKIFKQEIPLQIKTVPYANISSLRKTKLRNVHKRSARSFQ